MSKILATVTAGTRRVAKARRTIEHSPQFGGDQETDGYSPSGQIPPGGFLTG
ncbi:MULTISPECIES: hypothetical protein [Natronorubrum]|uniref:hypothetical protein n=1 Tax=Natronorubrum TaxID=134813 RepID=UPI0013BE9E98|nr:hypothetical protein [Natronorubrum tibetense]